MTVKGGISLPDTTHARALEHTRNTGTTLSALIDAALRADLTRHELADHSPCSLRQTTPTGYADGLGPAPRR